jgi:septal ring factor EnvC (AmiA/AmiB activator)
MSVTSKLMEELRKDEKLEDEFMTFIAERVALKPNIRGVILSAVLREVATKEDIEKLRDETREEIEKLREEIRGEMNTRFSSLEQKISSMDQRISSLEQRMSKIEGQLSLLIRIFIAFNLPILIGIIGILLRSYVP